MTRDDAKQKAVQMWGEMGVIGRATAVFALIGSMWLLVTAAYSVAGSLFVKRSDFQVYVHERDEYFAQRDSALAVWLVADSAQKADIRRQLNEVKLLVRRP